MSELSDSVTMEDESERPDSTTMEGMIANANQVLDLALDAKSNSIPPEILKACKAVALISVFEAGLFVSKSAGTGVILAQNEKGEWSPPSGVGLSSTGLGLVVGAVVKGVVFVIMNDEAMKAVTERHTAQFGTQLSLAVGPTGRDQKKRVETDEEGFFRNNDSTLLYAFSKGLFMGADMRHATFESQPHENKRFYGVKASAKDILLEEKKVNVPPRSEVPELHRKLNLLRDGKTSGSTD